MLISLSLLDLFATCDQVKRLPYFYFTRKCTSFLLFLLKIMHFVNVSDSLLPDSFPEGDPSDYALPVFLEEPTDSFATKAAPAVLRCRAAHAVQVSHFMIINSNIF